jgi:serine/threonine protein kinase
MGWDMKYPTHHAYVEAIQNPLCCFDDHELRHGQVAVDSLGFPRPMSGSFAVVFRIDCPSRSWAVRCFTRANVDVDARYQEIHRVIQGIPNFFASFEYLRDGILVDGSRYPILKMEWVEGKALDNYVADNHFKQDEMLSLLRQWEDLRTILAIHGIAHGDLQHGNILVDCHGRLKLVDYDGMYVPTLAGQTADQIGHENYIHPNRANTPFGAGIDCFSWWVIQLSLLAVATDASVWNKLHDDGECLLLRKSDYCNPRNSKAFGLLAISSSKAVRDVTEHIRYLCEQPQDCSSFYPEQFTKTSNWINDWTVDGRWIGSEMCEQSVRQDNNTHVTQFQAWSDLEVAEDDVEFSANLWPERAVLAVSLGVLSAIIALWISSVRGDGHFRDTRWLDKKSI